MPTRACSALLATALLFSAAASHAVSYTLQTPTTSGAGSVSLLTYSNGFVFGSTGTFNPGNSIAAGTTVYKMCFAVYNVSASSAVWTDNVGTHSQIPDDGAATTANSLTNFADLGDWTVDLQETMSNPVSGMGRMSMAWTVTNQNISTRNFKVYWFVDADMKVGAGSASDDAVERIPNSFASGYGVAIGDRAGNGHVDLTRAVRMESSLPVTNFFGLSDASNNVSAYWSNGGSYGGQGIGVAVPNIYVTYRNTIENDGADADAVSDTGRDCAGVFEIDLGSIALNASKSVTFYLTWGGAGTAPVTLSGFSAE